jgi:GT2 family glycosyltransferase
MVQAVGAAQTEGVVDEWTFRFCNMYLANGRNDCVRHFLKTDHDVMLFLDSDVAPTVEAFKLVLKEVSRDNPVVCGWYRGLLEDGTTVPVIYSLKDQEFFQVTEADLLEAEGPVVRVGAAGTGFMAIHRDLLEAMPGTFDAPCEWFAEPVMGGQMIGEDLGFCARVHSLGFPILVHKDARAAHYKEVAL